MKSIREIYKIGFGPSSSHTMGPERACRMLLARFPEAVSYSVTLLGSLAMTGEGHGTDRVIRKTMLPLFGEVIFDRVSPTPKHPNTMDISLFGKDGKKLTEKRIYSIGGGEFSVEGEDQPTETEEIYPEHNFNEILETCRKKEIGIADYVVLREGKEILSFLDGVYNTMCRSVDRGLAATGVLPGGLDTHRRAGIIFQKSQPNESAATRENRLVSAFAFAVGEENAAGGEIVTAPTCGSAGVLPAVLVYESREKSVSHEKIISALAVAGIVGNVIRTNASISGAECGCQAEIGSACSMAAAALAEIEGMTFDQIDYAAEVAMEHHLGLTCDPICGLVQIPCIERCAVGAMRAINACSLAGFLTDSRKIRFDLVVKAMYNTGMDLPLGYRETAIEGLAKYYPAEMAENMKKTDNCK